jgi:hypothetical protein
MIWVIAPMPPTAMAPGALLAVHFAEDVVEQDIGRAGRVDAGIIADHRVEAEGGLDVSSSYQLSRKSRADLVNRSSTSRCASIGIRQRLPCAVRGEQRADPPPALGGVLSARSRSTSATFSSASS